MALFKKTKKPATTVSEAIAPFVEVRNNLTDVCSETQRVQSEAHKRISDARAYAAEVVKTEGERAASASAEEAKAGKILDALYALLDEDGE